MPGIVPASGFGYSQQQTSKAGVVATSGGTAHTMGSYANLITSLAFDVHGLFIKVTGVSAAGTDTRALMDIAAGASGGGGESVIIPYLDVGAAGLVNTNGKSYFFPIYIPSGKSLSYRWQSVSTSDLTIEVFARVYGLAPHGFSQDLQQEWTQYGATASSSMGKVISFGSGVYGTEVQITSSTTRNHRWFHVGIDAGTDTNIGASRISVRLSRDTTATNIIGIWEFSTETSGEDLVGPHESIPVCFPLPAGSPLYIDVDGTGTQTNCGAIVYAA